MLNDMMLNENNKKTESTCQKSTENKTMDVQTYGDNRDLQFWKRI